MKISTLLSKEKPKGSTSMFVALMPSGAPIILCRDSFAFPEEAQSLLEANPGIVKWYVLQESMTQKQVDDFLCQPKP